MSLLPHVTHLEEQLAKLDYRQSTGVAIQSASNQVFVFTNRFLKDQGFNPLTIDFGEIFYTRDKTAEEFVHHKIAHAMQKALFFERPIIHLMKFASYDSAYSNIIHSIIEKGLDISDNPHLTAKLNQAQGESGNENNKPYYVPFLVSSNTLLGHETTRLCQSCYEIPSRDLRNSTWVSKSSIEFEERLLERYHTIERDSFNLMKCKGMSLK
jgi:hypothetical protein